MMGLLVGYLDYIEGSKVLEIVVVMGVEVLEFYFMDSREGKSFRDYKVFLM